MKTPKTPDDVDADLDALAAALAECQQAEQVENNAPSDQPTTKGDALLEEAAVRDERGGDELLDRRAHRIAEAELAPAASAGRTAYMALAANVGRAELSVEAVLDELRRQVEAVTDDKNLGRGKAMLAAQVHTLDLLYNLLAQRGMAASLGGEADQGGVLLKFALRAQAQCRATWETLHIMQSPPVARQTNIALNQQVNNAQVAPSSDSRAQNPQSKLLEQTTHEPDAWLDRRAPAASARSNPSLEAVGTSDGTTHGRGQSDRRA